MYLTELNSCTKRLPCNHLKTSTSDQTSFNFTGASDPSPTTLATIALRMIHTAELGQLKTLGTQMVNPIEIFIWVVIETNNLAIFSQFWLAEDVSTCLPIYHLYYCRFI